MPSLPELSLSLSGLPRSTDAVWGQGPRAAIEWAAGAGYRGAQLDAAMPGLRPRELDRSGRRDVASLLRRLRLSFSGLDLWIPEHHFVDAAQLTRALGAVESAVELAADLRSAAEDRGPVLSVRFPEGLDGGVRQQVAGVADRYGIAIADHRSGPIPAEGLLGAGIDPAEVFKAGGDVMSAVSRARGGPVSARLSDWNGTRRVTLGALGGKLDLLGYAASLDVAGYRRPVVVDLRDLDDPAGAAKTALTRWAALRAQ